jgi:two-component system OmpR family sensor kinase
MFRSLRSRLFLTYLLVTGLVLLFVGVSLLVFMVRFSQQVEYGRLNLWLSNFSGREGRGLLLLPPERFQISVERIDTLANARVLVLGSSGDVLIDSRPEGSSIPPDILAEISASGIVTRGTFRIGLTNQWLYVSSPVGAQHSLILASPQPTIKALNLWQDSLFLPVLSAGVVALLASAALTWLIAHWVAAPLGRMARASEAVAAGEYSQQLPLSGPEEVQSLAATFNEMVQRVKISRQAQRDFLANVSHELKTPLTSIQGFAQAILDGTMHEEGDQQRAASVIYDESDRLRRLVEDLLDLARIDAGQVEFERQPIDLGALLSAVVDRLSVRTTEESVHIESRLPQLPTLIGDGDRLAQVFTNLLDNAIKNTPQDGVVTLRGDVESGWISLHIDDTGPGIPPDELSRIFERFYQLDKSRSGGRDRGVGLGLAISREIVQAHGGRLVAQSTLGRGSRFTVQLPIVRSNDTTISRDYT